VVEVTLARLGKLLLEPAYGIAVKHGSAFVWNIPISDKVVSIMQARAVRH
jgi:hypothetical protein